MPATTQRRKRTQPEIARNQTPPQYARQLGVANTKVLELIRTGELAALNLANRGCTRPRYSIPPAAIEAFEAARRVVPDGGLSTTQKLRRRAAAGVKEFV
jgi:hypothetical protein